jgi:SAM-dependent methyltransferase
MFSQAEAYERFMGRWSQILAHRFVRFANPGAAAKVLDVGSGTGSLARAIVAWSPGIEVVGIDPSSAYVEYARANVSQRTHFEVGDAQALPFHDGTFDACYTMLVLNFIPDQRAALAEMRRVAKSGGTIAAAVWDHAQGMNMLRIFWEVADAVDKDRHLVEEPHPLLDCDGLRALWAEAALGEVHTTALDFDMRFSCFADYWEPFGLAQGPAGAYLRSTSARVRDEIERELRSKLLAGKHDGPFTLSARAWAIRGRKQV